MTEDRGAQENVDKETPVVKDEEFWKKFVLEQSLKDIDAQLDKLYASYIEDEKKLNSNFENSDESGWCYEKRNSSELNSCCLYSIFLQHIIIGKAI